MSGLSEPLVSRHCRATGGEQVAPTLGDLLRQGEGAFPAQVDALLRHAELEVLRGKLQQLVAILPVPTKLERPPDLRYVAPDDAARLFELRRELFDPVGIPTRDVPDVAVASHQSQCAFAGCSDPERGVRRLDGFRVGDLVLEVVVASIEVRALLGEQRLDDPERLAQAADAVIEPFEPVHLVLDLRPCRADPNLPPPTLQAT